MLGCRQIVALVLGVTAVTGLGLSPGRLGAEPRVEIGISPPPSLKPRAPARRPASEALPEDALDAERRPSERTEEEEGDEETAQRPEPASMAGDGNPGAQTETQGPVDGIIEVDEPARLRDGVPGPQRDARTAEEVAAFEGPPAGYNPYLYQIELQPLTDRRTLELFRLEPYVARGIRVGSFVIFPEAEIGALVSDNVFRSPSRHADDAFEARSTVRVVSDWRAHAVEFRASGLASFYRELAIGGRPRLRAWRRARGST